MEYPPTTDINYWNGVVLINIKLVIITDWFYKLKTKDDTKINFKHYKWNPFYILKKSL